MKEIRADNYSIFVSKNISKEINHFLKVNRNVYSKLFILVDENSLKHCYPQLVTKIEPFQDAEIFEIESGEENKTIEVCTHLWTSLSEYGADRKSLFVNIGGGVIGDMGGFVASAFKRGIDFINIPTTLLSQVDASIGGKVGIDLNNLKNEIGVYNNPKAVFVNRDFIQTLDSRQIKSGFAEVIKHALIADKEYWKKIISTDFNILEVLDDLIITSIEIKNNIVKQDPLENNIRKTLNFGHTIGHAIESYSLENNKSKKLLHGEAIAIGMICESYLSHKICKLKKKELFEITSFILLNFVHLSINQMDLHHLIELMKHDKKNNNSEINFSLLSSIGKCEINKKASTDLIIESFHFYTEQLKSFL